MGLIEKKPRHHIRQVLVAPGGMEARVSGRISGIDEDRNPIKGGDPCSKL
jgi:hypothetical protein